MLNLDRERMTLIQHQTSIGPDLAIKSYPSSFQTKYTRKMKRERKQVSVVR